MQNTLPILLLISAGHFLNDMFQAVIPSVYPLLKETLGLSFFQIGIITLVNQLTASLLQPLVGYISDNKPRAYRLPVGMGFTLSGLVLLSFAPSFVFVLFAVALVGCGSSVLHPESSKIARLASGGKKGMAQSIFQVGGNLGRSFGPIVVALLVIPHGQGSIRYVALLALVAIFLLVRVGRWYGEQIALHGKGKSKFDTENRPRITRKQIRAALVVLLVLMFSKDFYMSNIQNYLIFYLMEKFELSAQVSQWALFGFLFASAVGILFGGYIGDRFGRKYVIWASILGVAPFAILLPYMGVVGTVLLAIGIGLVMSSAMSAILVYATELLPGNVGVISGVFFGLSFGLGGIGSALFGYLADAFGMDMVFFYTSFLPLLGIAAYFLPNLEKRHR